MHTHNSFLTLTYNDENLPENGSLNHEHFQKFIRSLRITTGKKIRFYMCGEYGAKYQRPHYHALLFGHKFPDEKLHRMSNNNPIFRSAILEKAWPHGYSEIGAVTYKSAAYTARYILKKHQNEKHDREITNHDTGEITVLRGTRPIKAPDQLKPEYTNMSLKPGIGATYLKKYISDIFPGDKIILPDGKTASVPKYYRELLRREHPELAEKLKQDRIEKAKQNPNNTKARLKTRESIKTKQAKRLIRTMENAE